MTRLHSININCGKPVSICVQSDLQNSPTADSHHTAPGAFSKVALNSGTNAGLRSATAADCTMDMPAKTRPTSPGGAANVSSACIDGPAGAASELITVAIDECQLRLTTKVV